MKKLVFPCLAAAFATASSFATPVDDLTAAAKKLSDSPNYSWTATTQMAGGGGARGGPGFGGGPVSGQTEKGGFTVITREFNGNSMQTVRKGEEVVMQNPQGTWMTMEEMRAQFAGGRGGRGGGGGGGTPPGGGGTPPGGGGGNRGGGGRGGPGFFGGGAALPGDEAVALVGAVKEFTAVDDLVSGVLTGEAIAQRLSFGRGGRGGGGNPPPAPTNASGTVKFWLKDGALVKYEVHVKGTVEGRNGPQEIDRTTTTEITNVGSTKVDVPEAAKKKFSA